MILEKMDPRQTLFFTIKISGKIDVGDMKQILNILNKAKTQVINVEYYPF